MRLGDQFRGNSSNLLTRRCAKLHLPIALLFASLGLAGNSGGSELTGSPCSGIPISETPETVTAKLSKVDPGLSVTQITNSGFNWNTYADIPAYSNAAKILVFNHGNRPAAVASANVDGSHAQVISGTHQGTQVQVTGDGQFAYYQGQNPDGSADIYLVPLTEGGACRQIRLSNLHMRPEPPAGALIISNSTMDRASHHNVIAFSEGSNLHRVLDDGTALQDLKMPDRQSAQIFHRIRLNPVFPNIVCFKRDMPLPNPNGVALPEIWVVDLNAPNTAYSVTGSVPADHASWSNDGTKLGYIYNGLWWVADVLKADGSFDLNPDGRFTLSRLGPAGWNHYTVNFCNLAPDTSVYVCSERNQAIYLMSLDGTRTRFLASPDSSPTGAIFNGIPKPRFLDKQHIVFSSDRTGTPEVYVISGFSSAFP